MSTYVKICGITDLPGAMAAVEAGADALGFVFAESVRQISASEAARIAAELPGSVDLVAVFLRPDVRQVSRVLATFPADVVQADHGSITQPDGPRLLPVFREGDDESLAGYLAGTVARRFHYEGRSSGAGETVDWEKAKRLAMAGRMTLAGGLTPDNVADAIAVVAPFGVDVSSGVESAPGVKDHEKIKDFVVAARQAQKESVNT